MTQTKRCHSCSTGCQENARFCGRCGASLDSTGLVRSATRVTPLLQRWRRLSRRLTRKDVKLLLGEPLRIQMPSPSEMTQHEDWHYVYRALDGSHDGVEGVVRICPTDGRLLSWNEPDWSVVGVETAAARP